MHVPYELASRLLLSTFDSDIVKTKRNSVDNVLDNQRSQNTASLRRECVFTRELFPCAGQIAYST